MPKETADFQSRLNPLGLCEALGDYRTAYVHLRVRCDRPEGHPGPHAWWHVGGATIW